MLKNLTTMPVKTAAIIVPSLVPTKVKLKKISDSIIARVMQLMSNTIFILPIFLCVVSAMAFTKALPAFIITLAITDSEMPKPRTTTPLITKASLTAYTFTEIKETDNLIHLPQKKWEQRPIHHVWL